MELILELKNIKCKINVSNLSNHDGIFNAISRSFIKLCIINVKKEKIIFFCKNFYNKIYIVDETFIDFWKICRKEMEVKLLIEL